MRNIIAVGDAVFVDSDEIVMTSSILFQWYSKGNVGVYMFIGMSVYERLYRVCQKKSEDG